MADVHFLFRDRTKRLRAIVELLLLESDEDEPSRRDGHGNKLRKGGYRPTPQQDPEAATGQSRWRHKWWLSRGYKMLERDATYDEASHWGKLFRSRTGVPRILFDQLVDEAKSYDELPDHRAGDTREVRRGRRMQKDKSSLAKHAASTMHAQPVHV